nr:hypothetical protein [Tanacetum cinerariifolium]
DAGGEDIARSITTSESVHAGIGTGAGIEILAMHALDLGYNLVKVVPVLAPRGHACNLERVVPEERPLHMGPLSS